MKFNDIFDAKKATLKELRARRKKLDREIADASLKTMGLIAKRIAEVNREIAVRVCPFKTGWIVQDYRGYPIQITKIVFTGIGNEDFYLEGARIRKDGNLYMRTCAIYDVSNLIVTDRSREGQGR